MTRGRPQAETSSSRGRGQLSNQRGRRGRSLSRENIHPEEPSSLRSGRVRLNMSGRENPNDNQNPVHIGEQINQNQDVPIPNNENEDGNQRQVNPPGANNDGEQNLDANLPEADQLSQAAQQAINRQLFEFREQMMDDIEHVLGRFARNMNRPNPGPQNNERRLNPNQREQEQVNLIEEAQVVFQPFNPPRRNGNGRGQDQPQPNDGNINAQAFVRALQGIKLTTVSSKIPVPKFESNKDTPTAFLTDVERYFRAQNHPPEQWLYLVKTILPIDAKAWWDHRKQNVLTWNAFRQEFINRYDSWIDINERKRMLYTRQQKKEPIEQFIYEMVDIAKRLLPDEHLRDSVQRAKQALNHRIRGALGPGLFQTPEELFQACRTIHKDLEQADSRQKFPNYLPPLYQTQETTAKKGDNAEASSSKSSYNGGKSKTYYNKEKTDANEKSPESSTSSSYTGSTRGGYSNGGRGRSGYKGKYRGSYQGNGNGFKSSRNDSTGQRESQGNNSTTSKGNIPQSNVDVRCLKCRGFGHNAKQCPNKSGVAYVCQEEDMSDNTQNEDSSQKKENKSQDLN